MEMDLPCFCKVLRVSGKKEKKNFSQKSNALNFFMSRDLMCLLIFFNFFNILMIFFIVFRSITVL